MTDMQGMLFPPLEDESSSRDVRNSNAERIQNNSSSSSSSSDQVLPQDLRDRFSKVRSLLREKTSAEDEDGTADLKRKQEQAAVETARAVQDEVARLQNGIAELEDMYAMQQRQQRLVHYNNNNDDGDGEEEDTDFDDDEDDGQGGLPGDNHNNAAIVFPALPSLANAVEPDVAGDASSSSSSSHGSSTSRSHSNEPASARDTEAVVTTENILCDA